MKWMERSKRSLTVRMKHEDDHGMNEDSNLSHSVRASIKEDSQRTTTQTDNKKRETTKTKDLQCMTTHASASTTLTCSPSVAGHFTHCWASLCASCRQCNCCRCTHLFNFWPVREFLAEIYTAKTGLLRLLSLHCAGGYRTFRSTAWPCFHVLYPAVRLWKGVCQEFCIQRRCSKFPCNSSIPWVGPKMILRLGFVDLVDRIASSF